VFVPCDAIEARKATMAAAHIWGPVYLRFAREKTPVFTTDQTPFAPGRIQIFWDPSAGSSAEAHSKPSGHVKKADVLILGCGPLLHKALLAARALEKEKIGVIVANCHTIKPLDEKTIASLAKRAGAVVTVEEHQVSGGLGGAVAEALARHEPVPMEFVGMHNVFGESGPPSALIEKYGMGVKDIHAAVKRVLKRKK